MHHIDTPIMDFLLIPSCGGHPCPVVVAFPLSGAPTKKGLLQNLIRNATALFLLNLGKIVYNKAMIRR